jgi:hypothetical protein
VEKISDENPGRNIMDVKVISPEIPMILEADVLCVTEGSNHSTDIKPSSEKKTRDYLLFVPINFYKLNSGVNFIS